MSGPVFVALTQSGADLARRIIGELGTGTVHGRKSRVTEADATFDDTNAHLRTLFDGGPTIVAVLAPIHI